ncbi:splicing factor, suppressor of white-apricot homolog [Parasteatoda tepidariorum]|uniref:splicing factor, suppressor of white-apricot homolog n=1 Tax=Parasteatoda tepidariorum TaxID=114398 RepID=UPI00077FC5EA|nr:splicing factor, suppressor of white-apricot homolog [Parasteatoda tepidariorum]
MADISSWNVELGATKIDPNEKLFLFGYSCKLFPPDEKAVYIEKGQHLIPWMGDKTLMIDRYDVRGYLHDLKQYEPKPGGYDHSSDEEKLIDEERYRSLRTDMTEEQLYQEEELKRLRAAIAGDGAYHEIGFSYDNPESDNAEESSTLKVEDPEDDLYEIPEGLKVPKGLEVPYNMKIHAIIEKTATFVSEQGGQMEIIIKMKQHANPQFGFMHLDNPLHPYYKHLLKEIKSGSYKPVPVRRGYDACALVHKVSRSEDEDDDGHYLHPSLMSGKANDVPKFTVPTINFRRSDDDSYSLLVKNLQQHRMEETPQPEILEENSSDDSKSMPADCNQESSDFRNLMALQSHHIVPPPPDIQPIVNKMAEYVAKNGEDFETIVKSRKDKRFDFLNSGHEYYNYYVYQRDNAKKRDSGSSNEQNNAGATSPSSEPRLKGKESGIPFISVTSDADVPSENVSSNRKNLDSGNVNSRSIIEDYDALYSLDSQETPELQPMGSQDSSDSLDFLNSPSDVAGKEGSKPKISKVLKGPISFSLKAKESETSTEKSKLTPVLLGDDSDEDNPEKLLTDREESDKLKSYSDDVHFNYYPKPVEEPKIQKPKDEALEAKLAEERIKDKLLATARERLAHQRKEKQLQLEQQQRAEQLKKEKQQLFEQQKKDKELQLERKRKAALFLKMLQRRDPDSAATAAVPALLKNAKKNDIQDGKITKITEFWSLPDTSNQPTPEPGILFPLNKIIISTEDSGSTTIIPGIKTDWLDGNSDGSAPEEPSSRVSDKPSSDSDKNISSKPEKKKKRKRKSRSRSRDRSRSSKSARRVKDRHRSKSPPKHYKLEKSKREKEKQLPAAYANINRSRSRSRSPRRYRSMPAWRRR